MGIMQQLYRVIWHDRKRDMQVEQTSVLPGQPTAAPTDIAPDLHVTIEPMPEPAQAEPTSPDEGVLAPEMLPPPEDAA